MHLMAGAVAGPAGSVTEIWLMHPLAVGIFDSLEKWGTKDIEVTTQVHTANKW